jgi:hypothetical protein
MGNRATITITDGTTTGPTIYLHWNGGPESVYPFLHTVSMMGVRAETDYYTARLVQAIGNFFGGGLSIGISNSEPKKDTCGDNGAYFYNVRTDTMERYTEGKKLTPKQIAEERAEAYAHGYNTGTDTLADKLIKCNAMFMDKE